MNKKNEKSPKIIADLVKRPMWPSIISARMPQKMMDLTDEELFSGKLYDI